MSNCRNMKIKWKSIIHMLSIDWSIFKIAESFNWLWKSLVTRSTWDFLKQMSMISDIININHPSFIWTTLRWNETDKRFVLFKSIKRPWFWLDKQVRTWPQHLIQIQIYRCLKVWDVRIKIISAQSAKFERNETLKVAYALWSFSGTKFVLQILLGARRFMFHENGQKFVTWKYHPMDRTRLI